MEQLLLSNSGGSVEQPSGRTQRACSLACLGGFQQCSVLGAPRQVSHAAAVADATSAMSPGQRCCSCGRGGERPSAQLLLKRQA